MSGCRSCVPGLQDIRCGVAALVKALLRPFALKLP